MSTPARLITFNFQCFTTHAIERHRSLSMCNKMQYIENLAQQMGQQSATAYMHWDVVIELIIYCRLEVRVHYSPCRVELFYYKIHLHVCLSLLANVHYRQWHFCVVFCESRHCDKKCIFNFIIEVFSADFDFSMNFQMCILWNAFVFFIHRWIISFRI